MMIITLSNILLIIAKEESKCIVLEHGLQRLDKALAVVLLLAQNGPHGRALLPEAGQHALPTQRVQLGHEMRVQSLCGQCGHWGGPGQAGGGRRGLLPTAVLKGAHLAQRDGLQAAEQKLIRFQFLLCKFNASTSRFENSLIFKYETVIKFSNFCIFRLFSSFFTGTVTDGPCEKRRPPIAWIQHLSMNLRH